MNKVMNSICRTNLLQESLFRRFLVSINRFQHFLHFNKWAFKFKFKFSTAQPVSLNVTFFAREIRRLVCSFLESRIKRIFCVHNHNCAYAVIEQCSLKYIGAMCPPNDDVVCGVTFRHKCVLRLRAINRTNTSTANSVRDNTVLRTSSASNVVFSSIINCLKRKQEDVWINSISRSQGSTCNISTPKYAQSARPLKNILNCAWFQQLEVKIIPLTRDNRFINFL